MLCYVNVQEVHLLEINFLIFIFIAHLSFQLWSIVMLDAFFSQLLPALASSTVS